MLLRKKFMLLFFIFIILIAPVIYAQMCEVAHVRDNLRKMLYEYFQNPSTARMELGKIKDLLDFYLTIPSGEDNIDCSGSGANSDVSYYIIVNESNTITAAIPRCSDGAEFGTCSANLPLYCYNGRLVNRCPICGCSLTKTCQSDGSCIATEPPTNIANQTQPTNVTNQTEPPAYTETCIDSDGGLAYYTKGTAVVYDSSGSVDIQGADRCVASSTVAGTWQHDYILDEVSCTYGFMDNRWSIQGTFYDCPGGCSNGICLETGCIDEDGGNSYFVKGQLTDGQGTVLDTCVDANGSPAAAGSKLKEMYCPAADGLHAQEEFICNCEDGACVAVGVNICIDTDSGEDYYTKGSAVVLGPDGSIVRQGTDRCVASSTVAGAWQHFYILDEVGCYYPEGEPSIYGKFYDCPSGCENGICQANATNTTQTCNINSDCGTDVYTGYYCQNNDVYGNYRAFSCINPGTSDSYCSSSVGSALVDDCADNESCFEGDSSCKSGEARTCIDSDGGKDYYAKGTTSWSFGSQWWNSTDYCMGTYLNDPSDKRVAEHYCPGGAVEYYDCPNSCAYGACVR